MPKIKLYHYTTAAGAQGILDSKKISMSVKTGRGRDDARYGNGVYLTAKAPGRSTREEIALNNYDGGKASALRNMAKGKIDFAICVEIDTAKVKKCEDERDIYLYPDRDLELTPDLNVRVIIPEGDEGEEAAAAQ